MFGSEYLSFCLLWCLIGPGAPALQALEQYQVPWSCALGNSPAPRLWWCVSAARATVAPVGACRPFSAWCLGGRLRCGVRCVSLLDKKESRITTTPRGMGLSAPRRGDAGATQCSSSHRSTTVPQHHHNVATPTPSKCTLFHVQGLGSGIYLAPSCNPFGGSHSRRHDDRKEVLSKVTAHADCSNRVYPDLEEIVAATPGRA